MQRSINHKITVYIGNYSTSGTLDPYIGTNDGLAICIDNYTCHFHFFLVICSTGLQCPHCNCIIIPIETELSLRRNLI